MTTRTVRAATRGRGRTRLPAAERRAEILHRSARLFQQRGYTGVSIDDIGADIGISGPALYRHFAGKEAILFEIGASFLDELLRRTDDLLANGDDPLMLAPLLIRTVAELGMERPAELTVTVRHLWSLGEQNMALVRERWTAIAERFIPVIVAAYPHLEPADAGLYVRACGGALINMSRARKISHPRLVEVATGVLTGMLSAELQPSLSESVSDVPTARWERASRREQVLDTAIGLFRERGFRGVSMAEIAEALGVTAAASYRHFKNKEDILATAILRSTERMALTIGDALEEATSADDALDRMLRAFVRFAVDNADLVAVSTTEYHHIDDEAKAQRRRNLELFADEWTHCLASTRPDLSPAEATALAFATNGLVTESVRSRSLARRPHLDDDLYRLGHAMLAQPPV